MKDIIFPKTDLVECVCSVIGRAMIESAPQPMMNLTVGILQGLSDTCIGCPNAWRGS